MKEYIPSTRSEDIGKQFSRRTRTRLEYHEDLAFEMTDGQKTFLDLLIQGTEQGVSGRASAKQLGFQTHNILLKIYREADIPVPSQSEASRANLGRLWQDSEFRQRNAEGVRAMLAERWQDPKFRERHAEAVGDTLKKKWQDSEFQARLAEAVRNARLSEENQRKYHLPTIQGIRVI